MATKKQTSRSTAHRAATSSSTVDLVAFFKAKLEAEWGPVDLKRAFDTRQQDVIIIDTRTPDAYAEGHIPQSVNIPTDKLESRLADLPKNKHIVPYCWSVTCHLATRAALLLAQKGYRVHELAGGIGAWKDMGFPIATAAERESALN